ncbi:MAG: phosphoribosyl-AMP cyclohydrolase [Actinomycetota bacterium]|jgi:phosphoribosyl-AMP cyclohydrolase
MAIISVNDIAFNSDGLVPAIIQDATSNRILMLGYMNRESLQMTVDTGRVVFWSRSRQELWRKGDTSGNIQLVRSIECDCDSDALLVHVKQVGPACHTGAASCFDVATVSSVADITVESLS